MTLMWALGIHRLHLKQLLSPLDLRLLPPTGTPSASELFLPKKENQQFLGCF